MKLEWSPSVLKTVRTPIVDPPVRVAGYFSLNRTHGPARMFYFYFQARNSPADAPLVLWMTGGPGCSSELAILYENGPYSLTKNLTLQETAYGWDVYHNVLFVDQPINTGFSYSPDSRDRVTNEHQVAEDMLDFLGEFFEVHPELKGNDFFVTGESYAGHYVPAVANRVYRARELGDGPYINLKGLAIGNGLTAPATQFPAYADYALENGLISQGLHDSIAWWSPWCSWGANFCDAHDWRIICVLALEFCQVTTFARVLGANPNINVYDITKKCDGDLCYDFSDMERFLNRPDVRKTLGVGTREWQACSPTVYSDMMGDWLKSYDKLLPTMLEDDVRVMIYAGELDLICNWLGNERWVDAMEWDGQQAWAGVKPRDWKALDGTKPAGTARELDGLSFVKVFKAGHMVPMDQPANALDMITRFTRGRSLASGLPLEQEVRASAPTLRASKEAHNRAAASIALRTAALADGVDSAGDGVADGGDNRYLTLGRRSGGSGEQSRRARTAAL